MTKAEQKPESFIWINGEDVAADIVWASATHVELMVENSTKIATDAMVALVLRGFLSLPMRVTQQVGSCVVLSFVQAPHRSVIDWITAKMVTPETKAIRKFMEENAVPDRASDESGKWNCEAREVDAQLADLFRARTQRLKYQKRSYSAARTA